MRSMPVRLMVALFLAVFPLHALAASLADRVPSDAIVFISWRGADALAAPYQGSHLQGIIKAANLEPLFTETLPKAAGCRQPRAQSAGAPCRSNRHEHWSTSLEAPRGNMVRAD